MLKILRIQHFKQPTEVVLTKGGHLTIALSLLFLVETMVSLLPRVQITQWWTRLVQWGKLEFSHDLVVIATHLVTDLLEVFKFTLT